MYYILCMAPTCIHVDACKEYCIGILQLTIPKDGSSNFNITDFSVRIMSLDHQTTTKQYV